MAQISITSSVFDTIAGLPVHPLAVHLAVVLVPLGALALIALAFLPKLRKAYLPVVVGTLAIGTAATFVAKESGEQLAERVGLPQAHAALGDILFPASVGLLLLAVAVWVISRATSRPKWQLQSAIGAAVVAAVAVGTLTYFVGHSGAEATWAAKIQVVQPEASAQPSESSAASDGITLEELSKHSTPEDCWTAVDGTVVDLTSYLAKHPGGSAVLQQLCGKDGTNAFKGQHSGQQTPMAQLQALAIGTLAATEPAPSASATDTGASTAIGALTVAEVAKHNSAKDCWSVVNGNVYDLTSYISSHPGGSGAIQSLCGKDGTQAFANQHGSAGRPNSTLAAFLLGPLAASNDGSSLTGATVTGGGEGYENEEEEGDR